jgi:hypothetical protein
VLVIYRDDHKFLLDQVRPRRGFTNAEYDLVIASQPYRARAPIEFKARRVIAPLARSLAPGGRLIAIHSYGHDPGLEIIQKVWPGEDPFTSDRHALLRATKMELRNAGRDLNFGAYADARSLFRYDMHTLPSEISETIGTSTLFAVWNAAVYVAQVEDQRLSRCCASTADCGSGTNPTSFPASGGWADERDQKPAPGAGSRPAAPARNRAGRSVLDRSLAARRARRRAAVRGSRTG